MRNSKRSSLVNIVLTLAISLAVFFPVASYAQESGDEAGTVFKPIEARLEIPIPGVDLSAPVKNNESITVPFLAEYISGVYTFLISIVGVIAGVMILIGGYQYLTSGGDKGRIENGKKRIVNALLGLVLALGSYLILFVINPDLVTFEGLQLKWVETEIYDGFGGKNTDLDWPEEQEGGVLNPNPDDNVPLIKQGNFKNVPYISSNRPECTKRPKDGRAYSITTSGCGIVAASMVTAFYQDSGQEGAKKLVSEYAELSTANGYRKCGADCECSGTSGGFYIDNNTIGRYGLKGKYIVNRIKSGKQKGTLKGEEDMIRLLKEGKPIIVSVGPSIFTNGGHFIVLTGINSDGSFRINDPNNRKLTYYKTRPRGSTALPNPINPDRVPAEYVLPVIKYGFYIRPKS